MKRDNNHLFKAPNFCLFLYKTTRRITDILKIVHTAVVFPGIIPNLISVKVGNGNGN